MGRWLTRQASVHASRRDTVLTDLVDKLGLGWKRGRPSELRSR
jgi:hypothetical protein